MDVATYLAAVPEGRREALARLRELCLEELTGFEEGIAYGMPVYVRAGETAGEIAWANQKQYISFYLMRADVREAFADRLAPHDMGKACLRFRNPAKVDFALLRDLLRATAKAGGGAGGAGSGGGAVASG